MSIANIVLGHTCLDQNGTDQATSWDRGEFAKWGSERWCQPEYDIAPAECLLLPPGLRIAPQVGKAEETRRIPDLNKAYE